MATGPGQEKAAGVAGLGHLRASHADRERVIETLKAAFVQGRLTKDELEARVGQAFAARTYADLAALTTDLPAWLADAVSLRGAPREPMSNAVKVGIWLVIAVAVPAVLSFLGGAQLFLLSTPFYFTALSFLGAEIAVSRHPKRARHRQLPPTGSASPGLPRAAPVVRPLAR
jgi:hypothetical protein